MITVVDIDAVNLFIETLEDQPLADCLDLLLFLQIHQFYFDLENGFLFKEAFQKLIQHIQQKYECVDQWKNPCPSSAFDNLNRILKHKITSLQELGGVIAEAECDILSCDTEEERIFMRNKYRRETNAILNDLRFVAEDFLSDEELEGKK